MPSPLRVALVGASGYTGAEALRLLSQHPQARLTQLCGRRWAGHPVADVFPSLYGVDLPPVVAFEPDAVAEAADFALLALPHGTAMEVTAELLERGLRVLDLSADHRFRDSARYAAAYGPHSHPESLKHAVYGMPERHREALRGARLVGCPGCYVTAVTLAAAPARFGGLLLDGAPIIADCKSGVSGAGRAPGPGAHYPETAEGFHAYKTLAHRHAPEMSRNLGDAVVHFVPHLLPINRGILATVYLPLAEGVTLDAARAAYERAYAGEPFVTLLPAGAHPDTRNVRGTNRCHLGLFAAEGLLCVQSAIDNLGKGAAGQAVQCLNLMGGLPETTGLEQSAVFP